MDLQQQLQQFVSRPEVQDVVHSPLARKTLAALVGFGLLRYANRTLSRWSVNSWQSDSWQGDKELVLVTGGTGGIGRQVMEDLAAAGARVVIVDIKEPEFKLRMFMHLYAPRQEERTLMQSSEKRPLLHLQHHQLREHQGRGRTDSLSTR